MDRTPAFELAQLLGKQARAQMLRAQRKLGFAIRKGALNDDVAQVVDSVDTLPERVAGTSIAGEDEAGGAGVEPVANTAGTV